MKYLLFLLFISGQLFAGEFAMAQATDFTGQENGAGPNALSVTMTEDEDERSALLNKRPVWLFCNDKAKEHSRKLYPEGGPWDDPNASKCKACLVACRRKGCDIEHVACPAGTGIMASTIAWAIATGATDALGTCVLPSVSIACMLGATFYSMFVTNDCDAYLSDLNNWPHGHVTLTTERDADADHYVSSNSEEDVQ